ARGFDWDGFRERRGAYIRKLNGIYADNLERSGVLVVEGRAELAPGPIVGVGERRFSAPHVLLAVGGQVRRPAIPGAELGLTSDDACELRQRPGRALIVGAGYVPGEFAGLFHALGSHVTILYRGASLLKDFDPMLGEALRDEMLRQGI